MAYFTGTPPETWAPTRFPKVEMNGVAGSGANAPIEEIMAKRADFATIDNVAWPQLEKQVPGLVSFPAGDECLQSTEMSTDVGLAVDKADPVFRDWLQAVYDEMKDQVTNEELRILKGRLKARSYRRRASARFHRRTTSCQWTINLQPIVDSWPFLVKALGMTLFISVLSTLFGFAIGVVVGGLRTYGGRVLNRGARLLRRHDAGDPAARRAGLDLLRLSPAHRPLHQRRDRRHRRARRPSRRLCRRDRSAPA